MDALPSTTWRLAHRDDREAGLDGDPLGGAVPGAGLLRLDPGVGHELGVGPDDAGALAVQDDGAVHLRQFAQPGRRELDVDREAPRADRLDDLVVAEHDQGAGAAPEDALETVAQVGARSDGRQGCPEEVVVTAFHVESLSVRASRSVGRPPGQSNGATGAARR